MDFNNKFYSGRDEKYGVTIDNVDYILKPVRGKWGLAKMLSEYTASVVYQQLELPVQKVQLITWKGTSAVLIQDFLPPKHYFVPFASLIEENFDKGGDTSYSYENIKSILLTDKRIRSSQEMFDHFWNMYVVDFLIGGGGRNASNWGFIGYRGMLSPAPVFDSSSSFYYKNYCGKMFCAPGDATPPRMTFNGEIKERIDLISSKEYAECSEAAKRILSKISVDEITTRLHASEMDRYIADNWFVKIIRYNLNRLVEVFKNEN